MANRTLKDAKNIHGTNPQYLIEKIIRSRIYDSMFWKEQCFALTAELMVDKAMELRFIGGRFNELIDYLYKILIYIYHLPGVYGGNIKPTPFICLVLKFLQIQPEKDIVIEFIKNEEFKYVRALGAFYLRLTGTAVDCYKYLEPLYNDNRKLRRQNRMGQFEIVHMDEFIDDLLREERVLDVILPRIQKRHVLEENGELEPKVSALDDDLDDDEMLSDDEPSKIEEKPKAHKRSPSREKYDSPERKKQERRRERSSSRDKYEKYDRDRREHERDRNERQKRHDDRDRDRERDIRDRYRDNRDSGRRDKDRRRY